MTSEPKHKLKCNVYHVCVDGTQTWRVFRLSCVDIGDRCLVSEQHKSNRTVTENLLRQHKSINAAGKSYVYQKQPMGIQGHQCVKIMNLNQCQIRKVGLIWKLQEKNIMVESSLADKRRGYTKE